MQRRVNNGCAVSKRSLIRVKKPQSSEAFPGAVIREGADELTLRAEEVGVQRAFIDTKHTELRETEPAAG